MKFSESFRFEMISSVSNPDEIHQTLSLVGFAFHLTIHVFLLNVGSFATARSSSLAPGGLAVNAYCVFASVFGTSYARARGNHHHTGTNRRRHGYFRRRTAAAAAKCTQRVYATFRG